MQMPIAEVHAQVARARVLLALDGAAARDEVETSLDRALALVQSTGARSYEPQIHVERARLARLLGDSAGRLAWLREAQRLFSELGATGHAERVAASSERLIFTASLTRSEIERSVSAAFNRSTRCNVGSRYTVDRLVAALMVREPSARAS
jgi:hypothetical protein